MFINSFFITAVIKTNRILEVTSCNIDKCMTL